MPLNAVVVPIFGCQLLCKKPFTKKAKWYNKSRYHVFLIVLRLLDHRSRWKQIYKSGICKHGHIIHSKPCYIQFVLYTIVYNWWLHMYITQGLFWFGTHWGTLTLTKYTWYDGRISTIICSNLALIFILVLYGDVSIKIISFSSTLWRWQNFHWNVDIC